MLRSIVQVIPREDFTVYCYFDDGTIKLFDVKPLLGKGVFTKISKIDDFMGMCTVINSTLAWDIEGGFDPHTCIDLDPDRIYSDGIGVQDPLTRTA